ncbi:MAG: D-amino acid aminotransferase [Gemmatimonadaceae bacterium]|nr:D-amino acid aminotransferase [Gemmatimonadaceae bacterium]MCW5826114.1 D-amino acid aminotransferase [Gemmatimonadaceae bacterium]
MSTVYLNGRFVPKAEALIPVEDRGFIFGDGIYEVVRAINGKLFAWDAHASRMAQGLSGLRIDPTGTEGLRDVCLRLLKDNALTDGEATVYLQVTRGATARTHHFPPAGTATTIYGSASRFVPNLEMRANGAKGITYPDQRWARCDLKTVNLLGPVMARQAASEAGAYEAILHRDGMVTEGAATNCFVVLDGVLRTAPLSNYILPGITRAVLLEIIREQGIAFEDRPVALVDLARAEEVFVCGTTTDVQAIVTLDGRPVGKGRVGPITARLRDALASRLYNG